MSYPDLPRHPTEHDLEPISRTITDGPAQVTREGPREWVDYPGPLGAYAARMLERIHEEERNR